MSDRTSCIQYAALPFRLRSRRPEVLLVTSRETRRWIIPKGWAEKAVKPHAMAAREAYEEAGVRGTVDHKPFGSYRYVKRLTASKSVLCSVTVYLLEVEEELDDWPEKSERERRWLSPSQAALTVGESGLVEMLLRLGIPPG
ncbi:NUDIX hydrolase [Azospirillum canadense]|uniref:NUDIX hydrolase n=1 Tax=Azospirillum canadense TaxID=403962 RepID=UPI0022276B76|nr:NUDIX hydrolase [Azospirillum canadense]MCW2243839.1 8-oxo-dGTP pyrophosphatase MutT (NUDIX family) [Azospirillum canadense]